MSASRLEELFSQALERSAGERSAFLRAACAGDETLLRELEGLVVVNEQAEAFFDSLSSEIVAASPLELESAAQPRLRIGPYQTRQLIGHGGMGSVYLAERADGDFDQRVALKLIHLDMETPLVRARFLAERQLLARLAHPNIARLQDGGMTEEGRPYFVMEYIPGLPITRYCVENELELAGILRLFLAVIDAVSYLHRNLVVHRDLKPSNILVGGDGQVKLVDFGIAKLLENETEAALTRTGERLLTPEYAAPEQIASGPITTAVDVYALGVVLYELLTGQRAHRGAARLESGEHESPAPPSTAAGASPSGGKRIPRDLDNICLMALRPEPERRYASAEQFGEDIERHLNGVPVRATPSTFGYRTRKFVRRHRRGVATATGLLMLLGLGLARERGLRGDAERARAEAQSEAAKAVAVSDFLGELLSSVDPRKARGREVSVAEVLDQAAERMEAENALADQPAVEAAVRLMIGNSYRAIGRRSDAEAQIEEALKRRRAIAADEVEILEAVEALAIVYVAQRRYADAEPLLERVVSVRREALGYDAVDTLKATNHLATVYWGQGRVDAAEILDRQVLESRRRVLGDDHPDTLRSMNGLAATLFAGARYAEAARLFRQALMQQQRLLGPDHPDTLMLKSNLAAAYNELGRYVEAEPLLRDALAARRRVLGEAHGDTAMSMHNLAVTLAKRARFEEAERLVRGAIAVRERLLAESDSWLLASKRHLADILRDRGRHAAAGALYLDTLALQRESEGLDGEEATRTEAALAELRLRQGDLAGAEALITRALEAQRRVLGDEHPSTLESATTLANLRIAQGRFEAAGELAQRAMTVGGDALGPTHPLVLGAALARARTLHELGDRVAAVALATSVYEGSTPNLGEDHPQVLATLDFVIDLYEALGDAAAASRYRSLHSLSDRG